MEQALENELPLTDQRRTIFAASMISAAGAAIFLILPLLIGAAAESLGLPNDKAGLIASSYFFGYLLICVTAVFWINRVNWRFVSAMGFVLLSGGLIASALVPFYSGILASMFISGSGAGILFGLALCIISETDDPDRYFGVKIVAEQLLGAALLFCLPLLMAGNDDFSTLAVITAVVLAVTGLVTFWLPEHGTKGESSAASEHAGSSLPVWIGLLALLVYFGGLSGVWSFIERIADSNEIDAVTIGRGLSFGVIGGGVGAFIAATAGDRFGRILPLITAALIITGVLWVYSGEFSGLVFGAVTFVFSGAWNYSLAYQLGIVASVDYSGRYAVLMSAALATGAMLGPAAAGFLITGAEFGQVYLMALVAVVIASIAFGIISRK